MTARKVPLSTPQPDRDDQNASSGLLLGSTSWHKEIGPARKGPKGDDGTRKTKSRLALVTRLFVAGSLLAAPVVAQTLDPGDTDVRIVADAVSVATTCDDSEANVKCETNYTLTSIEGEVEAEAASTGRKASAENPARPVTVQANISQYRDFLFSSTAACPDSIVPATFQFEAVLVGEIEGTGPGGAAEYKVTAHVIDLSDANKEIAIEQLAFHSVEGDNIFITIQGALTGEPPETNGSFSDAPLARVIPAQLTRGHRYRLALRLGTEATGRNLGNFQALGRASFLGSENFFGTNKGLRLTNLTASIGTDPCERISVLESRVDELEGRVEENTEAINALRKAFSTHTHTYLTGRGAGHNNTATDTGAPRVGN